MEKLLVTILLLSFTQSGWCTSSIKNACIANMMQIDGAVQQWALENHLSDTNRYSLADTNITQFLKQGRLPECPAGGVYVAGRTVNDQPYCTYHGGLYAYTVWRDQWKLIKDALFLALSALSVVAALLGVLVAIRSNLSVSRALVIKPAIMLSFALLVSQTRFLVMEEYRWSFFLCGPMLISALIGCVMAVLGLEQAKGASRRWLGLVFLLNFSLIAPVLFGFLSTVFAGLASWLSHS